MQSASSWASKVVRKCESKHRFSCGGDARRSVGRCTVTGLPNFLGWVDLLSYGAPPTRALRTYFAAIKSLPRETSLSAKSDERQLYFEASKGYCTFITYHFQAKYICLILYRSKMGCLSKNGFDRTTPDVLNRQKSILGKSIDTIRRLL